MYEERYRKIGLNPCYYRKMNKMTQLQLAEAAGISSTYLGRIERGECSGTALSIYWRLCDTLEIHFQDLLHDSE